VFDLFVFFQKVSCMAEHVSLEKRDKILLSVQGYTKSFVNIEHVPSVKINLEIRMVNLYCL